MRSIALVILPPVTLDFFPWNHFRIEAFRVGIGWLLNAVQEAKEKDKEIKCYIKHKPTLDILNEILEQIGVRLEPSEESYKYSYDDEIVIVSLKSSDKSSEENEFNLNDLDIIAIYIEINPYD